MARFRAPKDDFIAKLRMYWPKENDPSILNGSRKPPTVKERELDFYLARGNARCNPRCAVESWGKFECPSWGRLGRFSYVRVMSG